MTWPISALLHLCFRILSLEFCGQLNFLFTMSPGYFANSIMRSSVPESIGDENFRILYFLDLASIAHFSIRFSPHCLISHKVYGGKWPFNITVSLSAYAMTFQLLSSSMYLCSSFITKIHKKRRENIPLWSFYADIYIILKCQYHRHHRSYDLATESFMYKKNHSGINVQSSQDRSNYSLRYMIEGH